MADRITLNTGRLIIRDHIQEDLKPMYTLMADPAAMYYLPELFSQSLEQTAENLEEAIAQSLSDDRRKFFFAMEDKDTGAYIGEIGYTVTFRGLGGDLVNLGYFILPEFHGRGLTPEAVKAVMHYAFTDGGVHKILTGCLLENRASERVMIKCGFRREALLRAHQLHDGRWKDRVEYGLIREDYLNPTD